MNELLPIIRRKRRPLIPVPEIVEKPNVTTPPEKPVLEKEISESDDKKEN